MWNHLFLEIQKYVVQQTSKEVLKMPLPRRICSSSNLRPFGEWAERCVSLGQGCSWRLSVQTPSLLQEA